MGSSVRIRESFMKKTGFELRFTGNGRQASKQKKKIKTLQKRWGDYRNRPSLLSHGWFILCPGDVNTGCQDILHSKVLLLHKLSFC